MTDYIRVIRALDNDPWNGRTDTDLTVPTGTLNLAAQSLVAANGTTDDSAAITAASASAAAFGVKLIGYGTYRIDNTVTLISDCDLSECTWNFYGSGVAVLLSGDATTNIRRNVRLPQIIDATKPGTGWTVGNTGVRLLNCYSWHIYMPRVASFETGVNVTGQTNNGSSYNSINLGQLDNNKRNMVFDALNSTGWANQNYVFGGRMSHNSNEGTNVTGTRHILLDNVTNKPNNNVFFGTSLESPNVVEYVIDCYGYENVWYGCRFENTGTGARVNWETGSVRNIIHAGFAAYLIQETKGTGTENHIITGAHSRMVGSGTDGVKQLGVLQLENTSSSANPSIRIMPAGAESAGSDPTSAWCFEINATKLRGKQTGDTNERIYLDLSAGRTYYGPGNATPNRWVGYIGSTTMGWDGASWIPLTDNTYDIGITSFKPRYVRAGTGVQTGAFATASRPSAATAGVGTQIYDTTLTIPIWSDGTTWRNASGTAV